MAILLVVIITIDTINDTITINDTTNNNTTSIVNVITTTTSNNNTISNTISIC